MKPSATWTDSFGYTHHLVSGRGDDVFHIEYLDGAGRRVAIISKQSLIEYVKELEQLEDET